MVHVQRDTEKLHLVVMNHEHIAGGSSTGLFSLSTHPLKNFSLSSPSDAEAKYLVSTPLLTTNICTAENIPLNLPSPMYFFIWRNPSR